MEFDLRQLNISPSYAGKKASSWENWHLVVDKAMLKKSMPWRETGHVARRWTFGICRAELYRPDANLVAKTTVLLKTLNAQGYYEKQMQLLVCPW